MAGQRARMPGSSSMPVSRRVSWRSPTAADPLRRAASTCRPPRPRRSSTTLPDTTSTSTRRSIRTGRYVVSLPGAARPSIQAPRLRTRAAVLALIASLACPGPWLRRVIPIHVPPLRERVEDIPMLIEHFAEKHATRNGKSIDAVEDGVVSLLQEYHWPGNVRELEHTIERAVVLSTGSTLTRDAVTVEPTRMR